MQPKKVVFRKRRFKDTPDRWWWLSEHPMFEHPSKPRNKYWRQTLFHEGLTIEYHKVDASGRINDDASRNIHTACWLECGPAYFDKDAQGWRTSHDYRLDCGGPTLEIALEKLVKKVLKHYGDYDLLPYSKTHQKHLDRMIRNLFRRK